MTRSHASQGYLFLQVDRAVSSRRDAVVAAIRQAAATSQGARLSALALMVASNKGSHFTEVMAAIDKMVTTLRDEEASDLEHKETCEKDRDEHTREAAVQSRTMDELTEGITKLEGEIADIVAEIAEKQETIKSTEKELADAAVARKAEHE